MGVVNLAILEPLHETTIAGTTTVRLRGSLLSTGHPPLFFKWYSSLNAPTDPNRAALETTTLTPPTNPLDFVTSLKVGSHILTFTAKDVQSDAPAELITVQNAGFVGGPLTAASPCIIHVFLAHMMQPQPDGAPPTLSKASSTLQAEAPTRWGRPKNGSNTYEMNPDYHTINRIQYHWRFTPSGAPAGRPSADLIPAKAQLSFQPGATAADPPVVQYQGALPNSLGLGNYILTLKVEDMTDPVIGHEVSRPVVITN